MDTIFILGDGLTRLLLGAKNLTLLNSITVDAIANVETRI
jgi:hypothetical protein